MSAQNGSGPVNDKPAENQKLLDQLAVNLAITDSWIAEMRDAEFGAVGVALKDAISGAALIEKPDMDYKINAAFNSFAYPPLAGEHGLKNELIYGRPVLDSIGTLLGARCHEYIHALQYKKAAATHANPFNEATEFFLAPRDYMRLKEALEQDAYVKGAWLQSLAAHQHPDVAGMLDRTPMPVGEFKTILGKSIGLQDAFRAAASAASDLQGSWLADNTVGPARDLWHENAILEYTRVMGVRTRNGQKDFKFVRLEENDFEEIGKAFGLSTFDGNVAPKLSPVNQARLEILDIMCGIREYQKLPTLSAKLAELNLSRESYLEKSYKHVGATPPAPPKADAPPPAP